MFVCLLSLVNWVHSCIHFSVLCTDRICTETACEVSPPSSHSYLHTCTPAKYANAHHTHMHTHTHTPPLHIPCLNAHTYPFPTSHPSVPSLSVVEYKGISESSQKRLLAELVQLAEDCVGEVMVFQLVQHVQQFLDRNDQTALPSLHEQMVQREQRKEDERKRQSEREQETKQEMIEKEVRLQRVELHCAPCDGSASPCRLRRPSSGMQSSDGRAQDCLSM